MGILGLTKETVGTSLRNLEKVFRNTERGLFVGISTLHDGILVLVYRSDRAVPKEDDDVIVITIYYTTKADKLIESKVRREV